MRVASSRWRTRLGCTLALDDADQLDRAVRLALEPRVDRVKCDFRWFQRSFAEFDRIGDAVIHEIAGLARGRSIVVEWIEGRLAYDYLDRHWTRVLGRDAPAGLRDRAGRRLGELLKPVPGHPAGWRLREP